MGKYIPSKPGPKKSITDALTEAEEDHFIDCPTADIWIRTVALLLDAIFLYLLFSGVNQITRFTYNLLATQQPVSNELAAFVFAIRLATQAVIFYLHCIWPVVQFGGSPGKLILQLRVLDFESGKRLAHRRVILREVVIKPASFLIFGPLWATRRADRRTLHDVLTQTVVKRIGGPPS